MEQLLRLHLISERARKALRYCCVHLQGSGRSGVPIVLSLVAASAILVITLSGSRAVAQESSVERSKAEPAVAIDRMSWIGDFDEMLKRGIVRIGTVHNPLLMMYDSGEQSGIVVDAASELQKHLRETAGESAKNLNVVVIPFARDDLIPALIDGRTDVIMANLTITPARSEQVEFTNPILTGVSEVIVTGPLLGEITSFDELVLPGLHLRASSSYAESLATLNQARAAEGKSPVPLHPMDERLEDHDLLEMVAAGALPAVAVDSHKAELWSDIFEDVIVNETLTLREDGEIAYAIRKGSPELVEAMNGFVAIAKKGTLLGNILFKRYYSDTERIVNALEAEPAERLQDIYGSIRTHAVTYELDPVFVAAQGFQESRLDQSVRSDAGAIGIMQVLPSTAKDPNVGIPDIEIADRNVEAGMKYMRFIEDRYFSDDSMPEEERLLFTLAAYNAGPGNIAEARDEAEAMGYDRNHWFDSVEVAAAKSISREPVIYVRNILKYYAQYRAYLALDAVKSGNE